MAMLANNEHQLCRLLGPMTEHSRPHQLWLYQHSANFLALVVTTKNDWDRRTVVRNLHQGVKTTAWRKTIASVNTA